MIKLGESLLKLVIYTFCDKTFPSNSMFERIVKSLEHLITLPLTLSVIASMLKLDMHLKYNDKTGTLRSIKRHLNRNPSEFINMRLII